MNIDGRHYRTIWPPRARPVCVIDQTRLPHDFAVRRLATMEDAARGDPHHAGARRAADRRHRRLRRRAGACAPTPSDAALDARRARAAARRGRRPSTCAGRSTRMAPRAAAAARRRARGARPTRRPAAICDEDVAICRAIGEHGAALIREVAAEARGEPVNVLTHCNAGWLATVDWGTALAPIYVAHDAGHAAPCLGRRDAAAQPGRGAHRLGARRARRAAHRRSPTMPAAT